MNGLASAGIRGGKLQMLDERWAILLLLEQGKPAPMNSLSMRLRSGLPVTMEVGRGHGREM